MFLTLFLVGIVGFLAMTFLSLGHAGGHSGSHSSGSHAGHSGHHGSAAHFKGATFKGTSFKSTSAKGGVKGAKSSGDSPSVLMWMLGMLSPLQIFIYCLGFGATGLLVQPYVGHWIIWAALLGALVLNFIIIQPLMGLLMHYQSKPSDGLEGSVASEAEAVSTFDPQGRGLVRLTLDGQLVQLLATLESNEHHRGVIVSKGDTVVILEVDATRNQCRVSRELSVA